MEDGTVLRWLKSLGDDVVVGDELVEIETDKASMVYEADAAGTLIEILASEGDTLPIGSPIARIGEDGGTRAGSAAEASGATDAAPPSQIPTPPLPEAPSGESSATDGRARASPLARKIAREKGLELAMIAGSGPGGRIVKADVEAAAAATTRPSHPGRGAPPVRRLSSPPAGPTPGARERPETGKGQAETVELTKVQQTIARRMAESKATAPHF
jgi:pyruvate dehydrogenase E2 component (dihydrolipoamide acetyltransferase)